MNYLSYLTKINEVIILSILCAIIVAVFLYWLAGIILRKHYKEFALLNKKEEMGHALFVDLSPKAADVVDLAVEVWRINNRIAKAGNSIPEAQRRGIESSIQRFLKFLDKFEIKIVDHTGEKYNEGMNVDVLSFEKDENIKIPMVRETIEPSITCRGHIIKKGKIIVVNK